MGGACKWRHFSCKWANFSTRRQHQPKQKLWTRRSSPSYRSTEQTNPILFLNNLKQFNFNFNFNSIKLFSEKFPKKFSNFFFEREIDPHVAHRRHYSKHGDLAMEMNSEIIDRLMNILPILRPFPVTHSQTLPFCLFFFVSMNELALHLNEMKVKSGRFVPIE